MKISIDYNEQLPSLEEFRNGLTKMFEDEVIWGTSAIHVQTGLGGYELFERSLEEGLGMERVYIGTKCPRILQHLLRRERSSKKYYRLRKVGYLEM